MTDKELRKLSRLELLELLLEASKENKKLKEEIDTLKSEKQAADNIETLSLVTRQVENALKYANNLTDTLKTSSQDPTLPDVKSKKQSKADVLTDSEIYKRMLRFFANNDEKLNVFPSDIENDVRARIKKLLEVKAKTTDTLS